MAHYENLVLSSVFTAQYFCFLQWADVTHVIPLVTVYYLACLPATISFSTLQTCFSFTPPVCERLRSRYKHTDGAHNSGVVWGRVSQIHPALLQQVEVTVSVATEWNSNQLPIPTTGERDQHGGAATTKSNQRGLLCTALKTFQPRLLFQCS